MATDYGSYEWPPSGSGSGGSGTVTSVGLADGSTVPLYGISGSPVTTTGTLTFTLNTQSANTVFAGPTTGSAAQPTFRAIVPADIPTLNQNTTGTAGNITATSNSTLTTLSALSLPYSQVTGGPVLSGFTTDGVIYAASSSTVASTGVPTNNFALVGNGAGTPPSWQQLNLTAGVQGTLPSSNGGTGQNSSFTQFGVTYASTTTALATTAAGTAGFVLTSNGTSAPTFQANSGGSAITALIGDGTASGPGSAAFTLATVNSNVGSFGSSTSIPSFTVNGKGLITAASGNVVIAPAGTLSGTTLNSTVVTSSLTSVGTITSGAWHGNTVTVPFGGTGLTTLTANNVILGNGTSTPNFVAPSTSGNVLTSNGTTWVSAANASAVTNTYYSGFMASPAFWSTTSTSFTDPTNTGGNTLTQRQSNALTVTAGASNIPGITFTPSASTAVYLISASTVLYGTPAAMFAAQLTDGTTTIITSSASTGSSGDDIPITLTGIYVPGTGSAVTVKIQLATNIGTIEMSNVSTLAASIEWSIVQIK